MELQNIISNMESLNLNILIHTNTDNTINSDNTINTDNTVNTDNTDNTDNTVNTDNINKNVDFRFVDDISTNIFDNRYLELEVPNLYCKKYFDDEDFIYARLKIKQIKKSLSLNKFNSKEIDSKEIDSIELDSMEIDSMEIDSMEIDLNLINYIALHHIIIDFSENTLDSHKIYAKVLYLYQLVNSYYSSLRVMRPLERIKYMPCELLIWIENIVSTMRYIIDNNLFNYKDYNKNTDTLTTFTTLTTQYTVLEIEYFNELIYGLNLTVCHLKMIVNHYKVLGIPIYNMEEKHIKKMFQVLNNMCIIIIYLYNY
jgi:hypothetical protein